MTQPSSDVAELRRQLQLARSSAEASRVRAETARADLGNVWARKIRDTRLLDRLDEMLSMGDIDSAAAALARRRVARERAARRRSARAVGGVC